MEEKEKREEARAGKTAEQELRAEISKLERQLRAKDALIAELRAKQLGPAPDNVAIVDGKHWPIRGIVRCNHTFDEVRKGNVDPDVTFAIIDLPV